MFGRPAAGEVKETSMFKTRLSSVALAAAIGIGFLAIPQGTVDASGSVKLDSTNFPDANFRKFVADQFDKNKDGTLSSKEISSAETFKYSGKEISIKSLKGIEYLTSLNYLSIYNGEFSSIDLSKNTKLEYISISDEKLESINLGNLKEVTSLYLYQTNIKSLDVTKLTKLEKLAARSLRMTEIDLSHNRELKELDVVYPNERPQIKSLDLSNCPKLEKALFFITSLENLTVASGQKFESTPMGGDPNPKWYSSDKSVVKADTATARNSFGPPGTKLLFEAGKAGNAVLTEDWGSWKASCKVKVLYKDVTNRTNFWYEPTYYLSDKDVVKGYDKQTKFKPANDCTRAQMVTFLWRLAGQPKPKKKTTNFKDIKKTDYFYNAVLWAVEQGITTGVSKTKFNPKGVCTRAQTVTFLWRMAGKPTTKTTKNKFKDVKKSDYFYKATLWASDKKIVAGYSDGTFKPQGKCLRRQMVTFLYKYDKYVNG